MIHTSPRLRELFTNHILIESLITSPSNNVTNMLLYFFFFFFHLLFFFFIFFKI